ncbi:hypothetical protein BDQ12DRAFT_685340 [Crucibulum laeve]|uniref:J domain-containing protein n=1 Tax=Crucibulum laeve TaxID=68775 RepID=A0A5C3LX96_9AGAR|nr:hypothetical protein BDQ12DRAFT_694652 [Crucibulum laeve]TFK37452.1 hypothetical protein BDQ12DRAFT_685340 [Crucibulum laeve]
MNRFTLIHVRLASTAASSSSSFASTSSIPDPLLTTNTSKQENPFPYPTQPHPTPLQIFHLTPGATQAEIKARYYDLVRAHHPDSQLSRLLPQSEAHARFQSISAAYDALQKGQHWDAGDPYAEELERRRRAYYRTHRGMGRGMGHNRRAEYERPWTGEGMGGGFGGRGGRGAHQGEKPSKEQIWRERLILGVGVTVSVVFLHL